MTYRDRRRWAYWGGVAFDVALVLSMVAAAYLVFGNPALLGRF
jgi:hypothetical protein